MATSWNSADNSGFTLSAGDLVATSPSSGTGVLVRATDGKSTGKYYHEVLITNSVDYAGIGWSTLAAAGTGTIIDYFMTGHFVFVSRAASAWFYGEDDNTGLTSDNNFVNGDVLMFAVDFDVKKMWIGRNGTWIFDGDPATAAYPIHTQAASFGTLYPSAIYGPSTGAFAATGQFNASSQTYAAPIGFAPWDATVTGSDIVMPLTIEVILTGELGTLTAPLTIAIGEGGTITAPLTIAVRETGTLTAPLTVRVYEIGTLTAALRFNVYNPAVFSDTATLPAPVGAVPAWSVLVMLDDEDVSASLYGTVTVDAEEDASRVATFSLALSGAFNPTEKNRKPVTIDYRIGDTTWRIFTGRVDATVVDLQNRAIRFDCTDLRTDLLDGASPAQSDALTPTAYHSRVLYGKTPRGRDYLRQRLISYAGNMDLDAVGQLRVRSWSEGAVVKTHTDADVFDGSTSISISNATGAGSGRNEVIIETRTQRLRSAKCLINWYAADVDYYQPSPEIITEALDNLGEGWQAERAVISVDQNATDKTAIALSAELIRRWVQDVTTTRTYTLRAAGVAADAPIASSNRVGIETRYVESSWVDDGVVEQDTEPGSDLEEEQQKSIKAALNATRKDILAAHRAHRVEYDIPLDPTIDLHNVYRLSTDSIDAAGQCARVQHIMDLDKGEVTTRISLALYGAGAEAPDVPDDSPLQPGIGDTSPVEVEIRIDAPAMNNQITVLPISGIGTTPDWSLSGWACEVHTRIAGTVVTEITEMDFDYGKLRDVSGKVLAYRSTNEYDYDIARSQFRIDIPAIDSDYIDEETGDYSENQTISIPASLLTITF